MPLLAGMLGVAGCGGIEPVATREAETDPAALYMALTLEARAINLATEAPYHTIQLVATPRDARGDAMTELPAPTFRLLNPGDTAQLQVTPEGLVTALATGSKMGVIAELVAPGPVRHADTALITVTSGPPPVLASLSIEPASPEGAKWRMGTNGQTPFAQFIGLIPPAILTPSALDGAGQPLADLVIEFKSLDPLRATVNQWTGDVVPVRAGPVLMVARTTAYGVTMADTALFTVTWPMEGVVRVLPGPSSSVFEPDEIRIVPNGIIYWRTEITDSVDVVFDDPTNVMPPPAPICTVLLLFGVTEACGVGDMIIPGDPETLNGFRIRQFPVAGVYRYHSTRTGAVGRIVVTDEVPE